MFEYHEHHTNQRMVGDLKILYFSEKLCLVEVVL
jgi:hypothetical protein